MKKEITIEFKIDDLKASEIAKVLIDEFYNKKGRKPDPFLFHPICTRPHAVDVAFICMLILEACQSKN